MASKFSPPKGTKDFLPDEMKLRRFVFTTIRRAFDLFGYGELDTPAFESLECLTLKAGPAAEEEIYTFSDKSNRKLGLRFDLTSSTARVMASHMELKRPFYRYQIGKVWRYDRPGLGRYREFYQADADIIGSYSIRCEAELLSLAVYILRQFGIQDFVFLVNHRKLLDALLHSLEIDVEHRQEALRILDKLGKISTEEAVIQAAQKGISSVLFKRFLDLLMLLEKSTPLEHFEQLSKVLSDHVDGLAALNEIKQLFDICLQLGFGHHLKLSMTLARGLDYYTGMILEVRATALGHMSFGGGGRYDDLIGLYGGQAQGAVGFSFGIERLIELVKQNPPAVDDRVVLVAALDEQSFVTAGNLAQFLRKNQIKTRLLVHIQSPSKHLAYASSIGINQIVFVGENEIASGRFTIKNLQEHTEIKLSQSEMLTYFSSN